MTHAETDPRNPPPMRTAGLALIITRAAPVSALVVRTTYGDRLYQLPGGQALPGEDEWQACRREVREETGLAIVPGRLLAVDFMPVNPRRGLPAGYNFVRFGGYLEDLTADTPVTLPTTGGPNGGPELDDYQAIPLDHLDGPCAPYQARRIGAAHAALVTDRLAELRRGEPRSIPGAARSGSPKSAE